MTDELTDLQQAIKDLGYAWQAGLTSLSLLLPEERDYRLGLRPEFAEMRRISAILAQPSLLPAQFPPAWDWRNAQGADWTTPVRDQGKCGACVAFGVVAVLETMLKLYWQDANRQPDLSEAHLFFTSGGHTCGESWWPSEALEYAKSNGVPDEACLPYQEHTTPSPSACTDWQNRVVKAASWQEVVDVQRRKAWLSHNGPMLGCFGIHEDFFHYVSGVYRHTEGNLVGYHAACMVGYSEAEQAWIGKNSWGQDWGEAGWFKIGYGECGIDTNFAMYGIEAVALAASPPSPTPTPLPPTPTPSATLTGCNPFVRLMATLRRS